MAELTSDQLEQAIWNFCCSTAGTPNATAVLGFASWAVHLGEETWTHIASFLSAGEALLVSTTTPMLSRGLDRPFLEMILREQKARRRIQLLRSMEEEARHFLEDSEEDSEEPWLYYGWED